LIITYSVDINIEVKDSTAAPIIKKSRFAMEKEFCIENGSLMLKLEENSLVEVNLADKVEYAAESIEAPSLFPPEKITWTSKRSEHVDVRINNTRQTATFISDANWNSNNLGFPEIIQLTVTDEAGDSDTIFITVIITHPEQTVLLKNFPNPFNSETWIPYQLAQDANVVIRIYNHRGQIVRTLNLGRQIAGSYATKSKAAYWDGCSYAGEHVASGVYFYTIQTEQFKFTHKMTVVK